MEATQTEEAPAQSTRQPFPTTNQGKIDRAVELKNEGNDHFKEGRYKKAITTYATALAFTKGLPGRKQGADGVSQMAMDGMHGVEDRITAEQEEFLKEFECIIKTNIATCHIKLKNALKALDSVREALAINPKAWKAMLRQAEATLLLNNAEKALKILNEAAQNAPADDEPAQTAINKMKEKANLALKKEEAQQKKSFNNIFDRARATAAPGENWDDRDPDR